MTNKKTIAVLLVLFFTASGFARKKNTDRVNIFPDSIAVMIENYRTGL